MVCYSHRPLPTGRGPYRTTRSAPTPGSPHSMFLLNAHLQKRRPLVLGGEERRLLPSRFPERYAACPGKRPGSRWPVGACPARRLQTGVARLRMGGEEESARMGDSNPGCNYLVRGYSPSMHVFWRGDMPHYSPPLPFSRALCSVPRPAPRVALAGGRASSAAIADGRGTREDGRGGGISPNGGFQSRL